MLFTALAGLLLGCATPRPLNLSPLDAILHMEQALQTGSNENQPFHAAVFYPFEHALRFPGLLIGIEQSEADPVRQHFIRDALIDDALKDMPEFQEMLLEQRRVMFISHVLRTAADGQGPMARPRPCFVYNAYQPDTDFDGRYRADIDNIALCRPDASAGNSKPAERPLPTENYFANGWLAIDRIREYLQWELTQGGYTDLILIVMGWNTLQIEAIANFNSLVDRLQQTAPGRPFRPYVIGVTWPSQWGGNAAGSWLKAASLVHKANDADELGGGWLAALLDHAVYPALKPDKTSSGKPLPFTVIGHSFGARATSYAVCRGGILKPPVPLKAANAHEAAEKRPLVDLLVGLQAAYSLNRYSAKGAGHYEMAYPQDKQGHCAKANRRVFTASAHDNAAETASWFLYGANFPASMDTYRLFCEANRLGRPVESVQSLFKHWRATITPLDQTRMEADPECPAPAACSDSACFDYVDASAIMNRPSYGTGGHAHSDIYRTEVARMIWHFMPDFRESALKQGGRRPCLTPQTTHQYRLNWKPRRYLIKAANHECIPWQCVHQDRHTKPAGTGAGGDGIGHLTDGRLAGFR
jgi:hypothetical protein